MTKLLVLILFAAALFAYFRIRGARIKKERKARRPVTSRGAGEAVTLISCPVCGVMFAEDEGLPSPKGPVCSEKCLKKLEGGER